MTSIGIYHRALAHGIKWIATAFGAVVALNLVLMLVDWVGERGWGYPWYAMPVAFFMIGIAVLVRRVANAALRTTRSSGWEG